MGLEGLLFLVDEGGNAPFVGVDHFEVGFRPKCQGGVFQGGDLELDRGFADADETYIDCEIIGFSHEL